MSLIIYDHRLQYLVENFICRLTPYVSYLGGQTFPFHLAVHFAGSVCIVRWLAVITVLYHTGVCMTGLVARGPGSTWAWPEITSVKMGLALLGQSGPYLAKNQWARLGRIVLKQLYSRDHNSRILEFTKKYISTE